MALSSFGRGRDGGMETGSGVDASPASVPSTAGGLTAFIDQGSEFEGKLSFKDTVRIDGRFHGEISSDNTLIVGESGEIQANIRSNSVVVSGSVSGDIVAGKRVVLHKTARVDGNVEASSLVIEEGAILNGQVKMKSGEKKAGSLKAIAGGEAQKPKMDAPKS